MAKNFKLTIEYDGTGYHGWQRQKKDRSIQQEIETALATMTAGHVTVTGSGRTDAGVHAFGQTANFHCETRLTAAIFKKGLNSLLPDDIVIRTCQQVANDFHARYDAASKIYQYNILNRTVPAAVGRQYAWLIRRPLDTGAMRQACTALTGVHDFKAFEGSGSPRSDTRRHIMTADLNREQNGRLVFKIEANGFLRYMVRNIVGTLADVGRGKITAADFSQILDSGDRTLAGATAPAHGLFLMKVKYPSTPSCR